MIYIIIDTDFIIEVNRVIIITSDFIYVIYIFFIQLKYH